MQSFAGRTSLPFYLFILLAIKPIIMKLLDLKYRKALVAMLAAVAILYVYADTDMSWVGGTVFNMGTINESDGPVSHRFIMRNTGTDTISLIKAAASCDCTTAHISRTIVAPGDTASVTVTFNPYRREDFFHQKVAVVTNSSQRVNYLFVKGFVKSSSERIYAEYPNAVDGMRLASDTLYIYTRKLKGKQKKKIKGINYGSYPITPQFERLPEGIRYGSKPRTVKQGEHFELLVECSLPELSKSIDDGNGSILLKEGYEAFRSLELPVRILLME